MFPIEGQLIVDVMSEAGSALPDAPVAEEAPRRPRRTRYAVARLLRMVADRLEPSRCVEPTLGPHPRMEC
jgi:hypothetical protein